MRTAGIDLAADVSRTAVAVIEWSPLPTVLDVQVGVGDEQVLDAIRSSDKAGIDCPLGWPEPYLDLVAQHRIGHVPTADTGIAWRRTMARRTTDEHVATVTGLYPLSVSTDRIGVVALRAAVLLGQLAAEGKPVDRTGDGVVVEVYPAAALKTWGMVHRGYKGKPLDHLVEHLPFEVPDVCRTSDHAFDAVMCALVARAAAVGLVEKVPAEVRETAKKEGWIAIPVGSLTDLLGAAATRR